MMRPLNSRVSTLALQQLDPRAGQLAAAVARVMLGARSRALPQFIAGGPDVAAAGGAVPLLVQAVLDPLSPQSQQLSGVLLFLRAALGARVEVLLNPHRHVDPSPQALTTYYRYVAPALVPGRGPPPPPAAIFDALPPHQTLTLGMAVPEGWLVHPAAADHDLDNLRLEELAPGVKQMEASFALESILVEGACIDEAAVEARDEEGAHPRGVRLQLLGAAAGGGRAADDTSVMFSAGYFQLRAAPGVWSLRLAPGRSSELYSVTAAAGPACGGGVPVPPPPPAAPGLPQSVPVLVTSFSAKDMVLNLRKRADRMDEDVLDIDHDDAAPAQGKSSGPIHVFSVASGHMYERLLKIMVLSAVKRTRSLLKFWFIESYMSPQMKAVMPAMARHYGFEYGCAPPCGRPPPKRRALVPPCSPFHLVASLPARRSLLTYKMPFWLHQQTDRPRMIWAHKILVLDLLFPPDVGRVIVLDCDQVVRADLQELWDYDLGGAPLGFVPFSDADPRMARHRFWERGYWAAALRGRPYYMAGFELLDLHAFRKQLAGDRLRLLFLQLMEKQHSLANMDQDLINSAQHTVTIATLPQEWLWCETWNGAEGRAQAKTIDLCNNPRTREPKLQSARRIVAEWPDLNREAAEFTARAEAVLRGEAREESLGAGSGRFVTFLEAMVEGSVRTVGGDGAAERPAARGGGAHDASEL
jgi:UDP-glucose:glycoprotein glucosyltransferase